MYRRINKNQLISFLPEQKLVVLYNTSLNFNEHSPTKGRDAQRIIIKVAAITRVDLAHMKRKIEDGKRSSSSII